MKRLLTLSILLGLTQTQLHAEADSQNFIQKDLNEFRVYPRLQKAENYIYEGKKKEAVELLKEILEIDRSNSDVSKKIVVLCMESGDYACAKSYVDNIKPPSYARYYKANIYFNEKAYQNAYQNAASVVDNNVLTAAERSQNDIIALKSAIMLHDEKGIAKYLDATLHQGKSAHKCHGETINVISLLIEQKMYTLALGEIENHQKSCTEAPLPDRKLAVWADILRNAKRYDESLKITGLIGNYRIKQEQKVLAYQENGEAAKAAETMEEIYNADHSEENKKRLVYLYESAGMGDKTKKLYSTTSSDDPRDMAKLLYTDKEGAEQFELLKKHYPFEGLTAKEKFNFSSSLIGFYEKENNKSKILSIADDLAATDGLSTDQKLYLGTIYSRYGESGKSLRILRELYRTDPSPSLLSRLLHSSRGTPEEFAVLRENYPFAGLENEERFNFSQSLITFYRDQGENEKIAGILDDLGRMDGLSEEQRFTLSYQYGLIGKKQKAIDIVQKLNAENPKPEYRKQLTYLYGKTGDTRSSREMLLAELSKGCRRDALLELAYGKERSAQIIEAIGRHAPYPCLKGNERFNIGMMVARYYYDRHDNKRALYHLDKTAALPHLSSSQCFSLATMYDMMQRKTKALQFAQKAYRLNPRNAKAASYLARSEAESGYRYMGEKRYKQAATHIRRSLAYKPDNAVGYEQLGYIYYGQEQYGEAAKAFTKAIRLAPKAQYYESLAYCNMKLGQKKSARENFKKSIDLVLHDEPGNTKKLYALKSSVRELGKKFAGYLAYGTRLDEYDRPAATFSPVVAESYNGIAALELSYKPDYFDDALTVYLKTLSGVKNRNVMLEPDTLQPSFGLRLQPFDEYNLYFSLEKFIKGGDNSRDDTMIRTSLGLFDGYEFHPVESGYWYRSLYLDGAYYLDAKTYSIYGNYEHGYVWKLDYDNAFMPYLCTSVSFNNDNYEKQDIRRFDVGGGLSYLFWRDESRYESHRYIGRVRLEVRHQYSGNTKDDNAVKVLLELFF